MWFAGSLLAVILLVWIVDLGGLSLVNLVPWRLRPTVGTFLGPLLGTGLLVLLATAVGWLGHGYRWWVCLPLTFALAAVGVWSSRQRLRFQRAALLALFTAFASFPVLCPLLRFNAYNPFNDIFIYLTHAQWLQGHGFLEPAQASGAHPAWSLVAAFRFSGLRMGASFTLGWLQALFGREWSYEIYPVAAALPLVVGALAAGAGVEAVCPGRRLEAWLAALATAVTLNGFAFGAVWGFLHQTYGLAFFTGALSLRGLELARSGQLPPDPELPALRLRLLRGLPLALCAAALVWCYVELTPFIAAVLGLSYLFPWPGNGAGAWRRRWGALWPVAGLVFLLVNLEWTRAFRALLMQSSVLVGNPVGWGWWGFPAHALGLRAGIHDGAGWLSEVTGWSLFVGGTAATVFTIALLSLSRMTGRTSSWGTGRGKARPRALIPALLMIGITAVGFGYFRWVASNPWPGGMPGWPTGTGQSWSQFKLSNWVAPTLLVVVMASGVLAGSRWFGKGRIAVVLVLTAWCGGGLGWNFQRAKPRVAIFLRATGVTDHPFDVYRRLRESLASVPATARIDLETPDASFSRTKTRQMLTYFLSDRLLVGNWAADPGLLPEYLPPTERIVEEDPHDWRLTYRPLTPESGRVPAENDGCFRLAPPTHAND